MDRCKIAINKRGDNLMLVGHKDKLKWNVKKHLHVRKTLLAKKAESDKIR